MNTRTLHVDCNTRPVRLAFLVDKPEPKTLDEVFRLNTLLWGGMFNPVVVLDGAHRKTVGRHYAYDNEPYENEVVQLLREFDPDFLINYSGVAPPPSLTPFGDRILPREGLRWNPWGTGEVSYFLESWAFLLEYWRTEFRFLQKPPMKFAYFDFADAGQLRTYLAARYGAHPEGHNGDRWLADNCGASAVTYDESFRKSFRMNDWAFPIGITTFKTDSRLPRHEGYILFLFDPKDMFDVVDYWNLRAAGLRVFPLPIDHYRDFVESAKSFAELSTYRISNGFENWVEIVKGRSVDDLELESAGQWLLASGVKADRLSLRGWVPRFGVRHYRISPELEVHPVLSKESDEIIVVTDGHGTLQGPSPDCELDGSLLSQHWATDLQFYGTGDEKHTFRFPWLHPECDKVAGFRIGHGFGPDASRVSKQGIVAIRRGERNNLRIDEPTVVEVLGAYLRDSNLKYLETSSPGRAMDRIIDQLGGLFGCRVLQNAGVREIIDGLANGSAMHADEVRISIYKTLEGTKEEKQKEIDYLLQTLVSKKVLRQGTRLQCERCQRHDWYHVSELGEEFRCKKCFHVQSVPMLDKRPWHYVSDGLFRLEGKVAGCLTAILSLVFLNSYLDFGTKYVPSFNYSSDSEVAECDFAVLSSGLIQDDVDVIIGECKTFKELEDKQKKDIKLLWERTGAFLGFSTLSNDFSSNDKAFFEELIVAKCRPILLTRKHLELPSMDVGEYRHSGGGVGRDADVLSRQTVADVLGRPLAEKHYRLP